MRYQVKLAPSLEVTPSFIYYLVGDQTGWSANFDLHWLPRFFRADFLYPIMGINISPDIGFNLGGGISSSLTNQVKIFGEAKYVFSSIEDYIFNVGVLFNTK